MRVPATPAGYDQPRDFVRSRGRIRMIGIEGTGSWGAGLARPLGGPPARRPQGSSVPSAPSAAAASPIRSTPEPPPAEHRPGADALPVAKTGTGPCEQIRVLLAWRRSAMKARARRPPADHRPAGHRPRRRAHPLRPSQRRGGSSTPWPARAPPRPPTAPASATARALRRPGPPPPDPGPTRSPTSTPSCAHQPPAPPRRCSPPRRCAVNHRHPARRRRPTTPAESAPRHPSPPCAAPPRSPAGPREDQPPPTQPRRRPTGQPGAAPQRPARPATRAPRPTPPASPPRARTAKRYCAAPERAIAREAWHLLTHPQPAPRTDDLRRGRHERGLTLTQAAHHLNTHPARISELERGTRPDTTLTAAYRQWLNTQQPQTHTA